MTCLIIRQVINDFVPIEGLVLTCSDAQNVQLWIEMCSDERLFVQWQIKVIWKFGWINRNFVGKKVVQKLESSFCDRDVQWWIFLNIFKILCLIAVETSG